LDRIVIDCKNLEITAGKWKVGRVGNKFNDRGGGGIRGRDRRRRVRFGHEWIGGIEKVVGWIEDSAVKQNKKWKGKRGMDGKMKIMGGNLGKKEEKGGTLMAAVACVIGVARSEMCVGIERNNKK
jgi:hypothetical protein